MFFFFPLDLLQQSHNLDKNELNLLRACGAEGNNNNNGNENGNADEEPSPEATAAATSNQAVRNALIDCIMELDQKGAFSALCSSEDRLKDFIRDFLKKNRVSRTEPVRKVEGSVETQTDHTLANSRVTELVEVEDRILQTEWTLPVMADGEMQTDAVEVVAVANTQTVSTSKDNNKTTNTNTSLQNDSDSDDLLDSSSDHHHHSPSPSKKVKRKKLNLKKGKTSFSEAAAKTTGPIKATNRTKQLTKFASTTVTGHSTSTSTSDQKPLIINRKEILKPTRSDWAIKCPFCVDKLKEKKANKTKKKNDDEKTDEEEDDDEEDEEDDVWASLLETFTYSVDFLKHYIAVHQESDPKSGKALWKCFRCERLFKTRHTFSGHAKESKCFNAMSESVRRFQCPHCPVGFAESFKRAQHLESHIIAKHPKLVVFPGKHSDEGNEGDESDDGGSSSSFDGQKPSTSMAALTADSKKKQQQVKDVTPDLQTNIEKVIGNGRRSLRS